MYTFCHYPILVERSTAPMSIDGPYILYINTMSSGTGLLCIVILSGAKLTEQVDFLNTDYIDGINRVALKWKVSNKILPIPT